VSGVEALAGRLWSRVDRARIADSWALLVPPLLSAVVTAQRDAATAADEYVDAALAEQGADPAAVGAVAAGALTGVASDGRDLDVLLQQPALTALTALAAGHSLAAAMASGGAAVRMIAATQVADAGRVADQVALATRPAATGYIRMLVGRSCSRCVILAGRRYAVNAGFDRHPKCDCIHVPTAGDAAEELMTDPWAYFDSLSRAEQDRTFTAAGAEAIRLGANPAQVVNARRAAAGLTPAGARVTGAEARMLRGGRTRGRLEMTDVFGRQLFITSEGVTVRGAAGVRLGARETGVRRAGQRYRSARPPRLMPESIMQIAGTDRAEAIRLLKRFGYIT
jgi:hypothetical protein